MSWCCKGFRNQFNGTNFSQQGHKVTQYFSKLLQNYPQSFSPYQCLLGKGECHYVCYSVICAYLGSLGSLCMTQVFVWSPEAIRCPSRAQVLWRDRSSWCSAHSSHSWKFRCLLSSSSWSSYSFFFALSWLWVVFSNSCSSPTILFYSWKSNSIMRPVA